MDTQPTLHSFEDRRQYPRANAEIACKCKHNAHTNFSPATTIDLSAGGAALTIHSSRPTTLGQRLALAFNSPTCPVLKASKMIGARVVRVTPIDHQTHHIAVEFDTPQPQLPELITPSSPIQITPQPSSSPSSRAA